MTYRHVKAGERFVVQDAVEDTAYIIQRGSCLVIVEKEGELHPVDHYGEGDIVGGLGILTGEPRRAHVEMLTGRRPFPEDNTKALLDLHLTRDIEDPGRIIPDIPDELRKFIMMSGRCDPNRRFQDMDQAMAALRPLAQDSRLPRNDQIIDKRKGTVLFLTCTDENQPAFKRLVDVFKADARKLGVNVEITDNPDL